MSSSNEVAGLQVSVDATQADKAATSLDKLTASAVRADAATNRFTSTAGTMAAQTRQMSTAYADAGRAAYAAGANLSPLTQKLKEQIDLFGKSPAEVAKYRAAQAGLSQEEQKLVVAYANKLTSLQLAESAAKSAAKAEGEMELAMRASGDAVRLSSTQIRELLTVMREASAGRYTRIPGSLSILAQQGNLGALAMKALSSSLVIFSVAGAAAAAILGDLTYKAEKNAESIKLIETAFTATGRSALLSGEQIRQSIAQVQQSHNVNQAEATSSVEALARAPVTSIAQFQQATAVLGDLAAAMGEKVPAAAKTLANALENPTEGLRKLEAAHVHLTPNQTLTIELLQRQGKSAEASAALLDALTGNLQHLGADALTPLQTKLTALGNAWSALNNSLATSPSVQHVLDGFTALIGGLTKTLELLDKIGPALGKILPAVERVASFSLNPVGGALHAIGGLVGDATAAPTAAAGAVSGSINRGANAANVQARNADTAAKQANAASSTESALKTAANTQRILAETAGLESNKEKTAELILKKKELQSLLDTKQVTGALPVAAIEDRIAAIDEQLAKKDNTFKEKSLQLDEAINKAQNERRNIAQGLVADENKNVEALKIYLADSEKAAKISPKERTVLFQKAAQADIAEQGASADKSVNAKDISLQEEISRTQSERRDLTAGVALAENKNVAAAQEYLKTAVAINATTALRAKLLADAAIADKAAQALKVQQDAKALPGQIEGVQGQIARIQGNTAESQADLFHKQWDKVLHSLEAESKASGDVAFQGLVGKLADATTKLQAVAQIADTAAQLQTKIDVAEKTNSIAQKTTTAEVTAGLISNAQAEKQDVEANLALADALAKTLPELQKQADLMDGPAADKLRENIAALNLEILQLRTHTDDLTASLRKAFEGSFATALTGLLERTTTFKKAIMDVNKALQDAVISTISKGISNDLTTDLFGSITGGAAGSKSGGASSGFASAFPSLANLFGGGSSPIASTGAAATGTSEDQLLNLISGQGGGVGGVGGAAGAASPITAAFTTGSTTAATSITTAFSTGATTVATAITSAMAGGGGGSIGGIGGALGIGSGTSGISSTGAAAVGIDQAAVADSIPLMLASGGYTGSGSKYQPVGVVHAGEFVHRQEVVQQPSALNFLTDFNQRGMQAVSSWAGYAKGGKVDPRVIVEPYDTQAPPTTHIHHKKKKKLPGFTWGGLVAPESINAPLGGWASGGLVGSPVQVTASRIALPRTYTGLRGYADGGLVQGMSQGVNSPSVALPAASTVNHWKPGVQLTQNIRVEAPQGHIARSTMKQVGAEAFRGINRANMANN